ncbi:MAG: sulfur carrier protein ThiS [Phycisphaeraceae bacterium]
MNLTLNGKPYDTDARTVRELVEQLDLGKQAVAVEVNRELIPRKLHESTPLNEGDAVELVTLVGGG